MSWPAINVQQRWSDARYLNKQIEGACTLKRGSACSRPKPPRKHHNEAWATWEVLAEATAHQLHHALPSGPLHCTAVPAGQIVQVPVLPQTASPDCPSCFLYCASYTRSMLRRFARSCGRYHGLTKVQVLVPHLKHPIPYLQSSPVSTCTTRQQQGERGATSSNCFSRGEDCPAVPVSNQGCCTSGAGAEFCNMHERA